MNTAAVTRCPQQKPEWPQATQLRATQELLRAFSSGNVLECCALDAPNIVAPRLQECTNGVSPTATVSGFPGWLLATVLGSKKLPLC